MSSLRAWYKSGSPWIWLNAGAVSAAMSIVIGLLLLIAVRGFGQFWPADVTAFNFQSAGGDVEAVLGELVDDEEITAAHAKSLGINVPAGESTLRRNLVKVGNRDLTGADFRWFNAPDMHDLTRPAEVLVIEREEWGNFIGYPIALKENDRIIAQGGSLMPELTPRLARRNELKARIYAIEKKKIGTINYALEHLRLKERQLELAGQQTPQALAVLAAERQQLQSDYTNAGKELTALYTDIKRDTLIVRSATGKEVTLPLSKIIRAYQPNVMNIFAKLGHYGSKFSEFVFDDPREANTEGGIFPAIFGTVLMVLIMSLLVTPFGVIAAVYLSEYAKQGLFTRIVRIAVNNLAGVPSVVYGVFGLGFFVYFLGGSIDRIFFPEALPAPTFGTPGLLWSAVTLALLTVPVVIVATEEGLSRIPRAIREGSLALGATKAETLWRTVLPMATPAMMTGMILAVARAAGEVAPLMLVGVVKLAPSLPLDGNSPFLHLERKFMHLGFHIYDVGFQSPNVEAARPIVYTTAMLLVVIILVLNLAAIRIRNRLREKYNAAES
jgi:phosphate transport system permease protein